MDDQTNLLKKFIFIKENFNNYVLKNECIFWK